MTVAALILNWNGAEYITSCLKSFQTLMSGETTLEVVVVDNGSTDNSPALISQRFPKFTLLKNSTNLGYAGGNNVGLEYALRRHHDFVWIVNSDIQVAPTALTELVLAAGQYKNAGIFGSKIYFTKGFETHPEQYKTSDLGHVIWYAGGLMDWANLIGSHRGVDQVDQGQFDNPGETDFVTGASMFIRSQVLRDIGLLDPRYYLYYEENDFCRRAFARGWRLMYIPQSLAWHANAQATGLGSSLQDYYITRNRLLFGLTYAPWRTRIALVRESFRIYLSGRPWQRRAVLDFYTRNLGPGSYQP